MTTFTERLITNALTPIIAAQHGQLRGDDIPEYVQVLVATGAFDEMETKGVFNLLFRRGLFNLSAEISLSKS